MHRHTIAILVPVTFALLAISSACCNTAEPPAPKFVGQSLDSAKQLARLANAELLVGVYFIADENWRDDLRPDVVYLQTPQPGTSIAGSRAAVWLFRKAKPDRPKQVMPDVVGKTYEDALRELEAAQLPLLEKNEVANDAIVRHQYPRAGRTVFQGTSVLLNMNASPPEPPREHSGKAEKEAVPE
jgi:beta-lactam-binding protein with PASTA domain